MVEVAARTGRTAVSVILVCRLPLEKQSCRLAGAGQLSDFKSSPSQMPQRSRQ